MSEEEGGSPKGISRRGFLKVTVAGSAAVVAGEIMRRAGMHGAQPEAQPTSPHEQSTLTNSSTTSVEVNQELSTKAPEQTLEQRMGWIPYQALSRMRYLNIVYERMSPKDLENPEMGSFFSVRSQGSGFYSNEGVDAQGSFFYLDALPRPDESIKAGSITDRGDGVTVYEDVDLTTFGKGANFSSNVGLCEDTKGEILIISQDNASNGRFKPTEIKVTIVGNEGVTTRSFHAVDDSGELRTPDIIMVPLENIGIDKFVPDAVHNPTNVISGVKDSFKSIGSVHVQYSDQEGKSITFMFEKQSPTPSPAGT